MFRIETQCVKCHSQIDVFSANKDIDVSNVICDECEDELNEAQVLLTLHAQDDQQQLEDWYKSMYGK